MTHLLATLRSLVNAGVLASLLIAPMALASVVNAGTGAAIEQPSQAKKGLGLVLLVSLQRS